MLDWRAAEAAMYAPDVLHKSVSVYLSSPLLQEVEVLLPCVSQCVSEVEGHCHPQLGRSPV